MEGLLGLIVIAFIYNLYLSYKRLELLYKNDFHFGYLIHVLMDFNVIISIIAFVLIFFGIKSVQNKKKKLKEDYEDRKKTELQHEKFMQEKENKEKLEEERIKLEEIKRQKELEKKEINFLKTNGYLDEDLNLKDIFDFIREFGLKRSHFTPNKELDSERLDLKLEAVKKEEKLKKAIIDYNNLFIINDDRDIFNNFIEKDLDKFLIEQVKKGISFPFHIDPFEIIGEYRKENSTRYSYIDPNIGNLCESCKELNFIKINRDSDRVFIFENYFQLEKYDQIKKGIQIYWYPVTYRTINLRVDKFVEKKIDIIDKIEELPKIENKIVEPIKKEVNDVLLKDPPKNETVSTDDLLKKIDDKKIKDKKNRQLETKTRKEQAKKDKLKIDKNFKKIRPDLEKINEKFTNHSFRSVSEIILTETNFSFKISHGGFVEDSEIKYKFYATVEGYEYLRSGYKLDINPISGEIDEFDSEENIYQTYNLKSGSDVVKTIMEVFEREIASEEWPD